MFNTGVNESASAGTANESASEGPSDAIVVEELFSETPAGVRGRADRQIHYLCLDSTLATITPDGTYQWDISLATQAPTGSCVVQNPIVNIHSMRLGRTTWTGIPLDLLAYLNDAGRVAFCIEEFRAQSIRLNDTRAHFIQNKPESDVSYGTTLTTTGFFQLRGAFRFNVPFQTLTRITLNLQRMLTAENILLPDLYTTFNARQYFSLQLTNLVDPADALSPLICDGVDGAAMPVITYTRTVNADFDGYLIDQIRFEFTGTFSVPIPNTTTTSMSRYNTGIYESPWPEIRAIVYGDPLSYNGVPIVWTNTSFYVPVVCTVLSKPKFITTLELYSE